MGLRVQEWGGVGWGGAHTQPTPLNKRAPPGVLLFSTSPETKPRRGGASGWGRSREGRALSRLMAIKWGPPQLPAAPPQD